MPRIRAENIEAHKELTRSDLLQATQDILAEIGSADISLSEVAARVGIGRTTFYEYFRDRDDLIATMVEETMPGTVDQIIAAVPAELGPADRLAALVATMVEWVASDPVLGLILHRELPRLSVEAQDRIAEAHLGLSREMGSVYRRGVESGVFLGLPPDVAGRLIEDVIMSGARAIIASTDPEGRSGEIAGITASFMIRGLTPTGA